MINGTGQRILLEKLNRAGVGTAAGGAKHRWPKIVQVDRRTVKTEVFRGIGLIGDPFGGEISVLSSRETEIRKQKAVPS